MYLKFQLHSPAPQCGSRYASQMWSHRDNTNAQLLCREQQAAVNTNLQQGRGTYSRIPVSTVGRHLQLWSTITLLLPPSALMTGLNLTPFRCRNNFETFRCSVRFLPQFGSSQNLNLGLQTTQNHAYTPMN